MNVTRYNGYQLTANMVCLLFDARQVAYNWFVEVFQFQQVPAAVENSSMILTENSKAADQKTNTMSQKTLKGSIELRGTVKVVGVVLCIHHYEQRHSHYIWPFDQLLL